MNPDIPEVKWRNLLGQLRIRGDKGTYPLPQLSGGEKLKVALLGLSQVSPQPELLLLMSQKIIWILSLKLRWQVQFGLIKAL